MVRGWAFAPGLGLAGRVYVSLVDNDGARVSFLLPRQIREDVARKYDDAPLCSGFFGRIEVPSQQADGDFACVLTNVVNSETFSAVIKFAVSVRGGRIVRIVDLDSNLTVREGAGVAKRMLGPLDSTKPTAPDRIVKSSKSKRAAKGSARPDGTFKRKSRLRIR
jgi:hypothetical protein